MRDREPHIVEMPATIRTTYGTLPKDKAAEIIAEAKRREAEARQKEAEERAKRPQLKRCPFSKSMNATCKGERCALYDNYACAIVTGAAVKENRHCPFGDGWQPCGPACALYVDGHCKMGGCCK